MTNATNTSDTNKIGFHYFQDTLHYSSQDLSDWLPRLTQLSASWIVLLSESSRAIPENFISGLIDAGINPIIHFKLQLPDAPSAAVLKPIFTAYAKWGVKFIVLFDKPNDSSSWSAAGWSHQDLVERFIDRFLPLAAEARHCGLTPVFPPLMPGGSYWDTSFFKSSIQSLQRREQQSLLENMAVGVYAYTFGHELSWGQGGPAKWRQSKPYLTPSDSQDQRGFNNYQWVSFIAESSGVKNIPIIQFGTGLKSPEMAYSPEVHAEIVQSMIQLIDQSESLDSTKIIATNFWLLSAEPDSEDYPQAWFKTGNTTLPIVRVLTTAERKTNPSFFDHEPVLQTDRKISDPERIQSIDHYLLLPTYEWGVSEWHLDVIRAFILEKKPTVGFSTKEVLMAKKVTVIGSDEDYPSGEIQKLRDIGCLVDQIEGDGTSIATQLLER